MSSEKTRKQFEHVLNARQSGKIPHIFFREAAEIDWLSVETSQDVFRPALRPLLNDQEMSDFVGIPIQTFDMSRLPHDHADRDTWDVFSESELKDRFNEAGRIFREMGFPEFLGANQTACQNRRGEAFSGLAIPVAKANAAQLEKQNRVAGDFVYTRGLYFSTEGIKQSTPRRLKDYTLLTAEDLRFVPNTNDFPLITQLHELSHARQRQVTRRPDELDYLLELDADSGSFEKYTDLGGSVANVQTRIAARAICHTMIPYHMERIYSYYPLLLNPEIDWSLQKGILTQYDLKMRSAAHSMGQKCDIQPNDMMNNLKLMLEGKPIADRKFIQVANAFNAAVKRPDAQRQMIKGFEHLWHSGEKLHRDTLHVAAIAYESLDLFRNGPRMA